MGLRNEEAAQTYTVLDQSNSGSRSSSNNIMPSISKHPTRFTVHLPADFCKL